LAVGEKVGNLESGRGVRAEGDDRVIVFSARRRLLRYSVGVPGGARSDGLKGGLCGMKLREDG
jgi:hypothetical protein